jgi:hypothetical protein
MCRTTRTFGAITPFPDIWGESIVAEVIAVLSSVIREEPDNAPELLIQADQRKPPVGVFEATLCELDAGCSGLRG